MNTLDRAFGRLLREKRAALKLSQVEFARAVKWSQTTASRVEQGRRSVTLSELLVLAQVFRSSAADLLGELGSHAAGSLGDHGPAGEPHFSPGFAVALETEEATLAQLARYGVRFLGKTTRPALVTLPVEEVVLAALRLAHEPRVFETLPALLLKNADNLDWSKLLSGAYTLRLQNRLGMVVAAALQLKGSAKAVDSLVWAKLEDAHSALAEGKLDHQEVVGPPPKTAAAFEFLQSRTPEWLKFWHGLACADLESFQRHLPR